MRYARSTESKLSLSPVTALPEPTYPHRFAKLSRCVSAMRAPIGKDHRRGERRLVNPRSNASLLARFHCQPSNFSRRTRFGSYESVSMGRKKTHFDFFPFLASKPAFVSHAARRSSTVTVVPSLCLFQSLDRIIFGMTHISPMCGTHTRTHSFETLYVWRSCLAGKGTSDGEKRSISDSPTFSRRAGDPSRLECASPTHIERASRIGGGTSAPAVP